MTDKLNTVQILDSRIEPQPNPTYAVTIGPDQNQFYHVNASGFTNSSITFNNLTTLGKDRAYLDTFELELTVDITFTRDSTEVEPGKTAIPERGLFMPRSFPFNSVCDQVQVNINGGAFFSTPSQTIRARERYWDQEKLQESYANVCPCNRPLIQNEIGVDHLTLHGIEYGVLERSRSCLFGNQFGYASSATGPFGTTNFDILPNYDPLRMHEDMDPAPPLQNKITLRWREPVMCSPFSSRYDATYGRPLYNITAIDLTFKMLTDLRNMFICLIPDNITDWKVDIKAANLYYQVLTVTAPIPHDVTLVPYRRFVPYITNGSAEYNTTDINGKGTNYKFTSGVYTLNEVPTAIWIFAAPQLRYLQQTQAYGESDLFNGAQSQLNNNLFGFIKHLSISCGNTTQILDTAEVRDLYRIAKSNGCQDSYNDWSNPEPFGYQVKPHHTDDGAQWGLFENYAFMPPNFSPGAGSVLRLIPGIDIILPEQRLVPGANANNLVFQVKAEYDFNYGGEGDASKIPVALWILFEYVGVAGITPGNCMVTMNPLGNGAIMDSAPVVAASDLEDLSTTEGSGWFDTLKKIFSKANTIAKKTGIVSRLLNYVPSVGPMLSDMAKKLGYGGEDAAPAAIASAAMDDTPPPLPPRPARKRPRDETSGGAILGLGDFC